MKGMGKVVEWSVRDETAHVNGVSKLFRVYCDTLPHIVTDAFKHAIYDMARKVVELEDAFIDLAYAHGDIEGLAAEDVKLYIRYIADRRLVQLGLKPNWLIEENPLSWLDWIVSGTRHTNFFENKVAEYEKGGLHGDWGYPQPTIERSFEVYTKANCPWCALAKEALADRDFPFSVTDLSDDEERQAFYDEHGWKNGDRTMPKIWVHETNTISAAHIRMTSKLIGGYRDLEIYLRRLNSASPAH
jgi:glutaredoxin